MAFKDKEREKAYRKYYEQNIRSEESKKRKKETTRLYKNKRCYTKTN